MKRKTFWLGTGFWDSEGVEVFREKPKDWNKIAKGWHDSHVFKIEREDLQIALRGTGVKNPRKNSKQLIPFHIVPVKVNKKEKR